MTPTLTTARQQDLQYIKALAKRFTDQIGFLPTKALEQYIDRGRVQLVSLNDTAAGYLLSKASRLDNPHAAQVIQAAVQLDAQRHSAGSTLVRALIEDMAHQGKHCLQCWCAMDLESGLFWEAQGFAPIAIRQAGARRKRHHVLWRIGLNDHDPRDIPLPNRRGSSHAPAVPLRSQLTAMELLQCVKSLTSSTSPLTVSNAWLSSPPSSSLGSLQAQRLFDAGP